MENNRYPSDISKEQFENIRPLLETFRKKTKPRIVNLYDIFCAILYVLKSGCQWRMIPKDFPKWKTVYYYFQIWNEPLQNGGKSILQNALDKIVEMERERNNRKKKRVFAL